MSEQSTPADQPETRTTLEAFLLYFERRSLVMLGLGFASGLPYLLIFDTLSTWLRMDGASLQVIGFFGLATLSYSLKFLWAPWVDRTKIPILTARFGHRRSWMLVVQALIILGIWLIAGSDPKSNLALVAVFAVLVGFVSATQDVVIDAWRIETADDDKQGIMAAAYQWGWRLATFIAGALALSVAQRFGWAVSYSMMAVFMGIGILAVLAAPAEKEHVVRPIPGAGVPRRPKLEYLEWAIRFLILAFGGLLTGSGLAGNATALADVLSPILGTDGAEALKTVWRDKSIGVWLQLAGVFSGFAIIALAVWPLPTVKTLPGVYLSHALGDPLRDFFKRYKKPALMILALICFYRVPDFVLNIMGPFYLDLGFTLDEIGAVRKVFGVIATSFGVGIAGLAIARWGIMAPLLVGAFAGPVSNLAFIWLAMQGPEVSALVVVIAIDNFAGGFAGTCLIAYMSSLTAAGFTATQYAYFSSLYSILGKVIASQSGRVVEGAARSADAGGLFSPLLALVQKLPAGSLAEGAATANVTPAALGAGYIAFFLYSTVIGIGAVIFTLIVMRQSKDAESDETKSDPAAAPTAN